MLRSSSLSRISRYTGDPHLYPRSPTVLEILASKGSPICDGLLRISRWSSSLSRIAHSTDDPHLYPGLTNGCWRSSLLQDRPLSMVISSLPRISRRTGDPQQYPGLTNRCWRSLLLQDRPFCWWSHLYPGSHVALAILTSIQDWPMGADDPRVVQNLPFVNVQATHPDTFFWDLPVVPATHISLQDRPLYWRSLFLSRIALHTLNTTQASQNARVTTLLIVPGFLNVDTHIYVPLPLPLANPLLGI